MPNYVTIDDPITRVLPKSIRLETVESIDRIGFGTSDYGGALLAHDQEGITWVRGHHLPDTEPVRAARAAQAMSAETAQPRDALGQTMTVGALTSHQGVELLGNGFGSNFLSGALGCGNAKKPHT